MNNFNFNQRPDVDRNTGRIIVNDSAGLNRFLTKMYSWMGLAVLISAIVAYYAGKVAGFQTSGVSGLLLLAVWFILPFVMGRQAMKNSVVGFVELMVYAGLTGLMFSDLFVMYTGATLTSAFVSSASVFVAMSAVGVFTKRSLAKLGTQLFGALIGLLVAMVVNIFLHSPAVALFLSLAAVVIFSLLTMFDAHRMKALYNNFHGQVSVNGLAINGALELYLDFINIFISLVEIFGGYGNNNR